MRLDRARLTLTNRLVLLAALIVLSTTLLLMLTSASGVYQMAVQQRSARNVAYRDMLASDIGGGIGRAQGALRAAAEQVAARSDADSAAYRAALMGLTLENAQYLEGMVLLERGNALAAWPDTLGALDPAPFGTHDASATVQPFVWAPGDEGAEDLWMITSVPSTQTPDRYLAGRVRLEFVDHALAGMAAMAGGHTAIVFDETGRLLPTAKWPADLTSARLSFEPDGGQEGSGILDARGPQLQTGAYIDLTEPKGLGWRVAVVEPASAVLRQTWAALRPAAFGSVAAALLALASSLIVVSRVTQPIKQLEGRARELADEQDAPTPKRRRRDELGRLVDAFDSVELRLNRLNDIAELLAGSADRAQVLAGVTSSIAHMLGSVDVEVLLLTAPARLELVAAEGALSGRTDIAFHISSVPWIEAAITSGEATLSPARVTDFYLELHGDGASSGLAVPLRSGAVTAGVAVVVGKDGRTFTPREASSLRGFAAQASVAFRNARLFDEERRARWEAESLRAMAERVSSPGGIEETLSDVGVMSCELLGLERPVVVLLDRTAFGLPADEQPAATNGWLRAWNALRPDGQVEEAAYAGASIAPAEAREMLRAHGAHAALFVPLTGPDGLAGLLVLLAQRSFVPSSGDLALAKTVGKQGSLALEKARLFRQAKSRADNLETIFRISQAVGSSLQTKTVLNRVLDVVQKILSADAVMLMTYDPLRRRIDVPMARGILNREMLEATFSRGEDIPGRVFETHEPERYDDVAEVDSALFRLATAQGLHAALAVPLLARGTAVGVLMVFSSERGVFSAEDLELLRTFALQAALAIDNARAFTREHNVATVLQESILPARLPSIAGIESSSVYLPTGGDAEIGGDFYDLFEAPDGRVVISIGDVCGKGIAAATKTSMTRYALRGMVAAGLEPGRILAELNRMLVASADVTSIVTLWLGFLDVAAGRLVYANGGHPPGMLLKPSREIERLDTTGALLGGIEDAAWEQRSVEVVPGSTILLYTDGVTEARGGAGFFGEGRLRRALRGGGGPTTIAQRLLTSVQRFCSGELRDDAAILAVTVSLRDADVVSQPQSAVESTSRRRKQRPKDTV